MSGPIALKSSRTLLPVILAADNFPNYAVPGVPYDPTTNIPYVPFHMTLRDHLAKLPPVGLLRPDVVNEMKAVKDEIWEFDGIGKPDEAGAWSEQIQVVYFKETILRDKAKISEVMNEVVKNWKAEGKFKEALDGWRNEKYSIYCSSQSTFLQTQESGSFTNKAFDLERSACAIFGLATYGVHLTAYEGEGNDIKIWVPRRSETKATWPGKLDNTVAGGIPAGMTPLESIIKECDEEASLPEEFVKRRLRNGGVVTYFYITEQGFLQPEVEFIYDLQLPSQDSAEYVKPTPHDDEVESFALWTLPQVLDALYAGEFKPNCGLTLVDFLIRHGYVTPENEPNFLDIVWRMKRRLGVAVPM